MYVTLNLVVITGQTPCTKSIIKSKISKVVIFSSQDVDERNNKASQNFKINKS